MRLIDADALNKVLGFADPCANCKHVYGAFLCDDAIWQEVCDAISEAPTIDAEPKWIRCEERLPKKGQVVLVTNGKGNVRCGQFRCTDMGYWVWKGNTLETVIAWMPLPKPYVVEAEEENETDRC